VRESIVNSPMSGPEGLGARRPGFHGFTLVEVVFVMAILLILTSFIAPMFSLARWRADNAVQILATSLGSAQRLAVLRQHDVIVHFDTDARALRVHRDADNDGSVLAGEDVRQVDLPEHVGFGQGGAPDIPDALGDFDLIEGVASPGVTFHRSGSASRSGVLYLSPDRGGNEDPTSVRAITIERATGVVRCFSYRTGSWEPTC